jgi:hypothetical protein
VRRGVAADDDIWCRVKPKQQGCAENKGHEPEAGPHIFTQPSYKCSLSPSSPTFLYFDCFVSASRYVIPLQYHHDYPLPIPPFAILVPDE